MERSTDVEIAQHKSILDCEILVQILQTPSTSTWTIEAAAVDGRFVKMALELFR